MRWKRAGSTGSAAARGRGARVGLVGRRGRRRAGGLCDLGSCSFCERADALLRATRTDHGGTDRRLREADRHHGQRAQRRRGRPGRSDRHGRLSLTRRRVLHRELAALQELASKGLLASVAPSTLANTPSRFNSPDGKWVGVTARVSVMGYNTSLLEPEPTPDVGDGSGRSAVEGQNRHCRVRDRLPADRDLHRPEPWRGGRLAVAGGGQGERRQSQLSRQRDPHLGDQPGAGGVGRDQPVLLVP